MVEKVRLNFSFLSKKLAKGKNKIAKRNANKSGAKMVCPNFAKYPNPKILKSTKTSFTKKGIDFSFILLCFLGKFKKK